MLLDADDGSGCEFEWDSMGSTVAESPCIDISQLVLATDRVDLVVFAGSGRQAAISGPCSAWCRAPRSTFHVSGRGIGSTIAVGETRIVSDSFCNFLPSFFFGFV